MRFLELKIPPPAVALITAALMWLIARIAPGFAFMVSARNLLATGVAAAGLITAIAGVVTFARAKTTVNPTRPQSTSSLVMWGIYSVTRNPMYVGMLLALTAWAIFLSNAAAFLLLPAFILYINRFQIEPEERVLASLFGPEFAEYESRVRRWL